MNLLYEPLITAFLNKAHIDRDAAQIVQVLQNAYPDCKLPVEKTIGRLLKGETASPQMTSLGFLAAYVLDKSEGEVLRAYQDGSLKEFYKMFMEQKDPSVEKGETEVKTRKINRLLLSLLLGILGILVLLLATYIWLIPQKPNVQFPPMKPIKGGTFLMGDTFKDTEPQDDELPVRIITIDDFEISEIEITFELFDAYCIDRKIPIREDLGWGRANHPAIMMDWYEAIDFCNWLSELKGFKSVYTIEHNKSNSIIKVSSNFNNNGYRLPTESEWEYAAKVNIKSKEVFRFGNHQNIADGHLLNFNYKEEPKKNFIIAGDTSYDRTVPVFDSGMSQNGLYGMTGNVSEWCHDFYHPHFYRDNTNMNNPIAEEIFGKDTSHVHVLRGGNWEDPLIRTRATYRESSPANCRSELFGFRVVRRF